VEMSPIGNITISTVVSSESDGEKATPAEN
jgi:hypothetical protein